MSETAPPWVPGAAEKEGHPAAQQPTIDREGTDRGAAVEAAARTPLLERTIPLLALFLLVGSVMLVAAYLSVHDRQPQELLANSGRAHAVVSRWMNEGYFHYAGLLVQHPTETRIYRTWPGGYMVSLFVVESLYSAIRGHYSWRLAALHNQLISLLFAALTGLLAFRLSRRIGLDPRLALASGSAVVIILFTFPANLALYWEMSSQMMWAVFAIVFLLIEERCLDGRRTRALSTGQAGAAFLMTMMEGPAAVAFVSALGMTAFVLGCRKERWKVFAMTCVIPLLAAIALNGTQQKIAAMRFPDSAFTGSKIMFRTGLDGQSLYYGDHLDIAYRRDVARLNWKSNREYLFRWPSVFFLGVVATCVVLCAYIAGRAPRFVVEALAALIGTWVLYAAVFSQAFVIHPYLFDILLFTPLTIALFAAAPALLETMSKRSGAIILMVVFCACWYAMFQMRLYALWYPMPDTTVTRAAQ